MPVVRFQNDGAAGGQRRRGVAARDRIRNRKIACAKDRDRTQRDFLHPMIHPRARLTLRLSGIDRCLAKAPLTDDGRELAKLGRRLRSFSFELSDRQAGFERRALREFWRDGVEAVGDAFEERGAFGKTCAVITIECVIGQLRCAIDLFDSAKRKERLDLEHSSLGSAPSWCLRWQALPVRQ